MRTDYLAWLAAQPQHSIHAVVRAVLPLGEGTVLAPFCGSGSALAAASAVGYRKRRDRGGPSVPRAGADGGAAAEGLRKVTRRASLF